MEKINIDTISQEDFDTSESYILSLLRDSYPQLELRRGTAIRSLLAEPSATLHAIFNKELSNTVSNSSISRLLEKEKNGEYVDPSDVNGILSNFGVSRLAGNKASGTIQIVVQYSGYYTVPENSIFSTNSGIKFRSTETRSVSAESGLAELESGAWSFTVPVEAENVGEFGNIKDGELILPDTKFYGFISAYAVGNFSGGSDMESLQSVVSRIPEALSAKCISSKISTEAVIRSKFDSGNYPIIDVSTAGFGNPVQHRDKHNLFGVSSGGRVDIYIRNFTSLPTLTLEYSDIIDGIINVSSSDVPGLAYIYNVYDRSSSDIKLEYSVSYGSDVEHFNGHDIFKNETYGTKWRNAIIKFSGDYLPKHAYVVVAFLPECREIQDFIDNESVRPVGLDCVVRCPVFADVSISSTVFVKNGIRFDELGAKNEIVNYINNLKFNHVLTRAEIASILLKHGASGVDMRSGNMLSCNIVDSDGTSHMLSGDILDTDSIGGGSDVLVSRDTTAFTVNINNILLSEVYI